jgi:RHS repeat-associated protein
VTQSDQASSTTQHRTFAYDSLSRLLTTRNPETQQLPITYVYDGASNLISRTNPNQTSVTFAYDGLNRVSRKTLIPGGDFSYTYDTATVANGVGRLASVSLAGGDGYSYDSYDEFGRVTQCHQVTNGTSYAMKYGYDLANNMTQETYPSQRVMNTTNDAAGRTLSVARSTGQTFASGLSYSPHGAIESMALGNGLVEHTSYNAKQQPSLIGLGQNAGDFSIMRLDYTYGVLLSNQTVDQTQNNGNIAREQITIGDGAPNPTVMVEGFTYDGVNRLGTATETTGSPTGAISWAQTYGYDAYGNRMVDPAHSQGITLSSLTPTATTAFNQRTNQISMANFLYDNSGNLKQDGSSAMFVYDAENHQTRCTNNNGVSNYTYDGEGRRVQKVSEGVTTVFVYNTHGQLVAEYASAQPATTGISYLTTDHLGSTRIVTLQDKSVEARHDYLPFGEEIGSVIGSRSGGAGYGGTDGLNQKFTSKEHDGESELDYFGARYYSSAQGRFSSVDPLDPVIGRQGASDKEQAGREFVTYLSSAQHWNRYIYTMNNPLRYVDPDGFDTIVVGVDIVWDKDAKYTQEEKDQIKKRYLDDANKRLSQLDIVLVVMSETTGTATNLNNKDRSIDGYSKDNENVFFTKNGLSMPSTEVTRADQASTFILTSQNNLLTSGEHDTDSDLLAHGTLHVFGIAQGLNGYADSVFGKVSAEIDVVKSVRQLGHPITWAESDFANTLREGARKYAVGPKSSAQKKEH